MKLGEKEKRILSAVHFKADQPLAQISKSLRMREHTVRYHFDRLCKDGIIHPTVLVDTFQLGLEEYSVYFSLQAESAKHKRAILQALRSSNRVSWLAELGGSFQYAMAVSVGSKRKLLEFLNTLLDKFGNIFLKKSIIAVVAKHFFQIKCFAPKKNGKACDEIELSESDCVYDLDDLDFDILSSIMRGQSESRPVLAERIGIPRSTLEYRLKQMVSNGVIKGFTYDIHVPSIQMETFKLLLYAGSVLSEVQEELYAYAQQHPDTMLFVRCIGSWDYELTVVVENAQQMMAIIEDIYRRFDGLIDNIEVLTIFNQEQATGFMKSRIDG
ncbi:Lrp/AsnC family transcriptional regulator [Oligoflexia bacterium]|nr:Lrp/AsnC family transcriptional regulator [Oligoflexia bacterium]